MPENRVADASATLWGTFMSRVAEFACLAALSLAGTTAAQDFVSVSPDGGTGSSSSRAEPRPELAVVAPVRADPAIACANRNADPQQCRFHWRSALKQSALFLAIQHGGNAIGEGSVRRSFSRGRFFRRYAQALEHYRFSRWSDDDPFLVDYVAHPMMGAVVARIQVQNEPRALSQEVSGRATYWRSRLHALGWATLYAFQWELGPISESSIGNRQLPILVEERSPPYQWNRSNRPGHHSDCRHGLSNRRRHSRSLCHPPSGKYQPQPRLATGDFCPQPVPQRCQPAALEISLVPGWPRGSRTVPLTRYVGNPKLLPSVKILP